MQCAMHSDGIRCCSTSTEHRAGRVARHLVARCQEVCFAVVARSTMLSRPRSQAAISLEVALEELANGGIRSLLILLLFSVRAQESLRALRIVARRYRSRRVVTGIAVCPMTQHNIGFQRRRISLKAPEATSHHQRHASGNLCAMEAEWAQGPDRCALHLLRPCCLHPSDAHDMTDPNIAHLPTHPPTHPPARPPTHPPTTQPTRRKVHCSKSKERAELTRPLRQSLKFTAALFSLQHTNSTTDVAQSGPSLWRDNFTHPPTHPPTDINYVTLIVHDGTVQ